MPLRFLTVGALFFSCIVCNAASSDVAKAAVEAVAETVLIGATQIVVDIESSEVAVSSFLEEKHQAVTAQPSSGLVRGQLAMAYEANGRQLSALTTYSQAKALSPREFHWAYYHAVLSAKLGQHEQALASIEDALRLDDQYAAAWLWQGTILMPLQRFPAAASAFRQAIALKSELFGSIGLARALLKQGRATEALALLELQAAHSDRPELFHLLAQLYSTVGRPADSEVAAKLAQGFEPVLSATTDWPDTRRQHIHEFRRTFTARLTYADRLINDGSFDPAIRILDSLYIEQPADVHLLLRLVGTYIQAAQPEPAMQLLAYALTEYPDEALFDYHQAAILEQRGDIAAAVHHLQRALEKHPDDTRLLELLGIILSGEQKYPAALKALLSAGSSEALYFAGMIEGARQQWTNAVTHFQAAINRDPWCRKCYYYMGQGLGEMQRYDDARVALKMARLLEQRGRE